MSKTPFVVPDPPNSSKKSYTEAPMNVGLPSAIDLEEAVLGAILIDGKSYLEICEFLGPQMFFKIEHRTIYEAITETHKEGMPIDILTVSETLKKNQKLKSAGGDYNLIQLTNRMSSSAHIEWHARIIVQKFVLREMIRIGHYIASHAYHSNPDIFDILEYNEKHINRLKNVIKIDKNSKLSPEDELKKKMNMVISGGYSGIPIGHSDFDEKCGGLKFRELIVIAARPGMGKTSIVISITYHMAFTLKIPVAFFSLEMSETDLMNRYASRVTGTPFSVINEGKVSSRQYLETVEAYAVIRKHPLYLIDEERFHYNIVEKIKSLVKDHGVKIVFIDYVQLMKISDDNYNETAELRTITRDLKALAIKLDIPIVILSQLKREIDNRNDKRPMLSDLKQSGSIEEDADTIMFPFRPSYYKKDVEFSQRESGRTELDVAKGRNIGVHKFESHIDFLKFKFQSLKDYDG